MSIDRHPRTLQEAFGPYTSNSITEPHQRGPGLSLAACTALAAIIAALVLMW